MDWVRFKLRTPRMEPARLAARIALPVIRRVSRRQSNPSKHSTMERLLAANTHGDPMTPLHRTSKSGEKLVAAFRAYGFSVCGNTVVDC